MIQLLQFEPKNGHITIKITATLQHSNLYMFQALLVHNQGTHSSTRPLFEIFCI